MNPILTILLNPIARKVHHARAAATSAVGFSRLKPTTDQRKTAFLCPKTEPDGVGARKAFAPAGFIDRSANPPRRHLE